MCMVSPNGGLVDIDNRIKLVGKFVKDGTIIGFKVSILSIPPKFRKILNFSYFILYNIIKSKIRLFCMLKMNLFLFIYEFAQFN